MAYHNISKLAQYSQSQKDQILISRKCLGISAVNSIKYSYLWRERKFSLFFTHFLTKGNSSEYPEEWTFNFNTNARKDTYWSSFIVNNVWFWVSGILFDFFIPDRLKSQQQQDFAWQLYSLFRVLRNFWHTTEYLK